MMVAAGVKASTEKSHRMILKLVTKHKVRITERSLFEIVENQCWIFFLFLCQEILHQIVKPVLTDSNLASVSDEGHGEKSSLGDILDKLSKTDNTTS